jgi:hypothetical protein
MNSGFTGQVGQDSHRRPAVVVTLSDVPGVLGNVARRRSAPLLLSSCVADRRWVSAGSGAGTRAADAFAGVLLAVVRSREIPIGGRNHLTDGLIRRLFLTEPGRSVFPMEVRILRFMRP